MIYPDIHPGVFLSRPNRFIAQVCIDGVVQTCHVKNTGRCRELLIPGTQVFCQHHEDPSRKTKWSLITVQKGDMLVNLDSQAPNRLARDWVLQGGLGFAPQALRSEQVFGDSRFDLYFERDGLPCYLEVKGVTLEVNGVARFPDAPTERGTKHLRGLCAAVRQGFGAYVLFVVQLPQAAYVEPNWATDPAFSQALCDCQDQGVTVLAARCAVSASTIEIARQIPVRLPGR